MQPRRAWVFVDDSPANQAGTTWAKTGWRAARSKSDFVRRATGVAVLGQCREQVVFASGGPPASRTKGPAVEGCPSPGGAAGGGCGIRCDQLAGHLKHGPIALIEPGQPVFVVVPSPRGSAHLHPKVVSNIQEIRARGARIIAIAEEGDVAVLPFADTVIRIPLASPLFEPILAVVPLQIFAMELATVKGLDVDQPRNLAKSVTVE